MSWIRFIAIVVLGGLSVCAEEAPDYLALVKGYADTLIEHGRDHYGEQQSPLFAAGLDRHTLALLEGEKLEQVLAMPREAWGIRAHDRTLSGANPMHDENLYQALGVLTDLTGDAKYVNAADDALRWFLTHCQSDATGLFAWGEHIGWDFRTETRIEKDAMNTHEYFRPWILCEECFELAPEPMLAFSRGVWNHQIADHKTGNFSRHAKYDTHGPGKNSEYPRHGGFYIATWAHAYAHSRDDVYLTAIRSLVEYFNGRRHPETDILPSESAERSKGTLCWPSSNVSLAVDLYDSAPLVPGDLAEAMRETAARTDKAYLSLPHEPREGGKGFVTLADVATRGAKQASYADQWATGYGDSTNAQVADLLALRYAQTKDEGYRKLILECARTYRDAEPDRSVHLYPGTFGDVIFLELTAYELTKDDAFLASAKRFAGMSAEIFLDDAPLPRASSKVDHYEAITRGDTLMMALLKLYLVEERPELAGRLVYTDR